METQRSFFRSSFHSHRKAAVFTLLFFVFGAAAAGFCPCAHAAEQTAVVTKAVSHAHDCCPKTASKEAAKDCSTEGCLHHRSASADSKVDFAVLSAPSTQIETVLPAVESPLFLEGLRAFSYQTDEGQAVRPEPLYVLFRSLLI